MGKTEEHFAGERDGPAARERKSPEGGHVGRAVARLEEAVNDLVASAGESAVGYIDRAAERVRRQVALRRLAGEQAEPSAGEREGRAPRKREPRANYRPRPHHEPAWLWSDEPRSVKLCRDAKRGKLLGVCAGIGRYYGVEVWVLRCIAITALIFMTGLAVAAYLVVGLFVMEKEPAHSRIAVRGKRAKRDRRRTRDEDEDPVETEPRYALPSPHQQLRTVDAEFDEVELRLRRMETHITSGRYELHREFGRIGDGESAVN